MGLRVPSCGLSAPGLFALCADRVFGGVDKQTLRSHGFHRQTGEPITNSRMDEGDVYSAIAQALDVDFSGRRDMTALMKNG
jgi:hypothetical protein